MSSLGVHLPSSSRSHWALYAPRFSQPSSPFPDPPRCTSLYPLYHVIWFPLPLALLFLSNFSLYPSPSALRLPPRFFNIPALPLIFLLNFFLTYANLPPTTGDPGT
ncbi:hypothetical protein BDQ17DRAFT_1366091 [Cyathus striatus]|nr:hypothetical protein BDQ17DRAFT_1366091 [Cyathus striatus]